MYARKRPLLKFTLARTLLCQSDMKRTFFFSLTFLATISLMSCASQTPPSDEAVPTPAEQKTAAEPRVGGKSTIARKAAEDFIGMKGITADQRVRLMAIYITTYDQALQIQKDITANKLRLFDLISTTASSSAAVDRLKQKIVDLDQKRLVIMFKAAVYRSPLGPLAQALANAGI